MNRKIFNFNFDLQPAKNLRNAVNEKQNLSIDKEHKIRDEKNKKTVSYFAWDRICAIMDRIEDTLEYINLMQLGNCCSQRSAFDFYDFINNAYVVIDGIKIIGQIFALDIAKYDSIEKSQDVFGDVLDAGGTDGQFFNYIRSLCAVHPFNTTRHSVYMKDSVLHCCPFVVWSHNGIGLVQKDNRDLSAHIYTSKRDYHFPSIPLYINQFETYINKWISLISDIITAIYEYNDSVYDNYRAHPLKTAASFESEIDYVFYLKQEYYQRFGDSMEYHFDKIPSVLGITLSNNINTDKLKKFRNAIQYSLPFIHKSLEKMDVAEFDCTGIKGDNPTETNLLMELFNPSIQSAEVLKYQYNLSKVYCLEDDHYSYFDKLLARDLIKEMKDFLNRYIVYTGNETDIELVVLVDLALYLHALEHNCILNQNIPNDLLYRERLLTEEQKFDKKTYNPENSSDDMVVKLDYGSITEEYIINPEKEWSN